MFFFMVVLSSAFVRLDTCGWQQIEYSVMHGVRAAEDENTSKVGGKSRLQKVAKIKLRFAES